MRPAVVAFLLLLLLFPLPVLAAEKLSPFTEVVFEGETPFVRYEGKWYELLEFDGVNVARLVAFCKQRYNRK
jgi:lipocalin